MMSSVIPARLQFQCGHAALVTLPRIKGETASQRNDRVAREKSAALGRQCDFCTPAVAVIANGTSYAAPEMPAPEPVFVVEPEPELVVVAAEVEPVESIAEIVEEILAEAVEPDVDKAPAAELEIVVVVEETPPAEAPVFIAPVRVPRRRAPVAPRKVRAEEVARGRRFLVEYRKERVLHAVDIHDALRQATGLGAAQLTAITREG